MSYNQHNFFLILSLLISSSLMCSNPTASSSSSSSSSSSISSSSSSSSSIHNGNSSYIYNFASNALSKAQDNKLITAGILTGGCLGGAYLISKNLRTNVNNGASALKKRVEPLFSKLKNFGETELSLTRFDGLSLLTAGTLIAFNKDEIKNISTKTYYGENGLNYKNILSTLVIAGSLGYFTASQIKNKKLEIKEPEIKTNDTCPHVGGC